MLFNYSDISQEHLDEHIDRIISLLNEIQLNKITILTGGNALGKSLIRKQLPFRIEAALKEDDPNLKPDIMHLVASTSMQLRTESRPEWGALSSMMHDTPWSSTSDFTILTINNLLNRDSQKEEDKRFLVIDELEIGMSQEVQLGFCQYLNELLPTLLQKTYGILVITHSSQVVNSLNHHAFLNIEGLTEEQWLTRTIEPVSPDLIREWASALFSAVKKRSSKQ